MRTRTKTMVRNVAVLVAMASSVVSARTGWSAEPPAEESARTMSAAS